MEARRVKLVEDLEAEEDQLIQKQELLVILPQHHHLKVIQEEVEKILDLDQITEAAVAEVMAVREVMQIMEMMEHREVEQLAQSQDHL